MLRGLFRCLELSKCGRNQNKGALRFFEPAEINICFCSPMVVVILDSFHFRGVLGDEIDEEDIW